MSNEVRNYNGVGSRVIGYLCRECQKIKPAMLGEICNECCEKERRHQELLKAQRGRVGASWLAALARQHETGADANEFSRAKKCFALSGVDADQWDAFWIGWCASLHEPRPATNLQE